MREERAAARLFRPPCICIRGSRSTTANHVKTREELQSILPRPTDFFVVFGPFLACRHPVDRGLVWIRATAFFAVKLLR